jgi:hypothetical protein
MLQQMLVSTESSIMRLFQEKRIAVVGQENLGAGKLNGYGRNPYFRTNSSGAGIANLFSRNKDGSPIDVLNEARCLEAYGQDVVPFGPVAQIFNAVGVKIQGLLGDSFEAGLRLRSLRETSEGSFSCDIEVSGKGCEDEARSVDASHVILAMGGGTQVLPEGMEAK